MMESNSKSKRIWPLPGGDRRGTSGADAGRYSMQAIGGEGNGRPFAGEPEKSEPNRRYNLRPLRRLSRSTSRAGADCLSSTSAADVGATRLGPIVERGPSRTDWAEKDQEAQSITSSPKSLFSSISSSPPSYLDSITKRSSISPSSRRSISSMAEDVVQATIVSRTVPAKAKSRARKKWTEEMNKFILRTYFIVTKLETETRAYLTELHNNFIQRFPDMDVSRQRVGDQRRAIIRSKLLSTTSVNEIREEAETYLLTNQQNAQPPLTQMQPTQRMRWTAEHNETIIREYYRITYLETNKTAYRQPLHQCFISTFPHLAHITEQRVADQRRVIIANKLIDDDRLNVIKQEIADELGTQTANATEEDLNTTVYDELAHMNDNNDDDGRTLQPHAPYDTTQINLDNQNRNQEVDLVFNQALKYFNDVNPEERPFIPKQRTSKKLGKIVSYINDTILPEKVNIDTDFKTLQTIVYCVAWTAAKLNGSKLKIPPEKVSNQGQRDFTPNWQKRLERKLEDLRKKIGRLTQFINGNRSRTLNKQVNLILENYKTHTTHEQPNTEPAHYLDTLKQKLSVVSSRLRRYKACSFRKTQNNQFNNNERKFYQFLAKTTTNRPAQPETDGNENQTSSLDPVLLHQFWANIWEIPTELNSGAEWIQKEYANSEAVTSMHYDSIPIETYHQVLKATHNWKTPGSDHIHSYWYKKLTSIHPYIYNHINQFIKHPEIMPTYITSGITYMIPKDTNDTANPAKYRPITCLQTIYKIMTACLSQLIYKHIEENNILAEQQKGCRKFSQGCKEQLTIDAVVLNRVQKCNEDLFTIYIDYKKAFDSVPHSWLIKILEIYKIHPELVKFLQNTMTKWTTRLHAQTSHRTIATDLIKIKRGIFQGDSLSPLWFCLALNPLSNNLNSTKIGYSLNKVNDGRTDNIECTLNHLLYMDDIKIYSSTQTDLEYLIQITEQFSQDIAMNFGIDKCKINSIREGKTYQHVYQMETGESISPLCENETYKYLGYHQSKQIHYKEIKTKLTQNFKHRLNSILRSQLNSKNITIALNSYAIPVLTYSFGIINWTKTELKKIQRLINVSMTKHRKHHPRACIQRQILPRSEGGRGIIDIQNLHNRQITTLRSYFYSKSETSTLHKSIAQLDRKLTPLNLQDHSNQSNENITDKNTLLTEWARKSLHGRHYHDLSQPTVDKQASNEWLRRGELFPETEGFMIAIQDQVVETRNYQKHIMKIQNIPTEMCRRCNSSSETIQHITGACKAIAQTDYKFRHDQVANIIHQSLAIKYKLVGTTVKPTPYYKYTPETVLENAAYKLYFDRAILTDKTTHFNRPDLTLVDKTNKTALLIDIAIPNTHNLQSTIAEKLSKYIDLKNEITRMWHLQRVSIVPIVLSTTGVIPKQLFQSLEYLDLPKHTYILLQKAAILNTCRIVRKFLQTELPSEVRPTEVHLA